MNKIRAIIRAEALQSVPKGYRLLNCNEYIIEGDLHYIYDEYWLEDKGKAKTWQPINIGIGDDYYCAIRKNNSIHAWRRLVFWVALWLERFQGWKFRRFINE